MMNKLNAILSIGTILTLLSSCATNPVQLNPNYDLSKIHRVAVLGFEPYDGIPSSGASMATIFEKQLVGLGFNVVERQQVETVLKEQNFELSGAVDPAQAAALGKILGVDALVLGSVTLYNESRWGVVNVPTHTESSEPVMATRTTQVERDGKMVTVQEQYVADYNVTHNSTITPQTYRIEAEVGVVVKMVDTATGEIVWVGTDTEEGTNVQSASETIGDQITKALRKSWHAATTIKPHS